MIVSIDERSDNASITTYAEHCYMRRFVLKKVEVIWTINPYVSVYILQAKAWGFDGEVLKKYLTLKCFFVIIVEMLIKETGNGINF